MKKSDLKNLIKPIVSECIQEALLESGIVSNIVAEVMKGMMPVLKESQAQQRPVQSVPEQKPIREPLAAFSESMRSRQRELIEESVEGAYSGIAGMNINGVDIFGGVKAIKADVGAREGTPNGGALSDADPNDPGIDISKLGIIKQIR